MFVIVGLGNPGTKYEKTRHNAGRLALQVFLDASDGVEFEDDKYARASRARFMKGDTEVVVLFPSVFMNESGSSVRTFLEQKQLGSENLVLVYDDVDLPIGELRVSYGRGSGGHNGVESVINALGSKDFVRVRIGVSPVSFFGKMKKPQGAGVVSKFLLSNFSSGELKKIEKVGERVKDALTVIMNEGHEAAMNRFN